MHSREIPDLLLLARDVPHPADKASPVESQDPLRAKPTGASPSVLAGASVASNIESGSAIGDERRARS